MKRFLFIQTDKTGDRSGESGNVLFLILIAVALFAALSYAVTQSTRTGSGDASDETNLVSSSTVTQYPSSVRTSIVRMIVSDGAGINDLAFNAPASFPLTNNANGVFHPTGGQATFQKAPADVMASGVQGEWYFNANFEIPQIGTSGAGGNDMIAFLPNVKEGICRKLNEEHGIVVGGAPTFSGIPDFNATTDADISDNHLEVDTVPTNDREDIDDTNNSFDAQPFGCFYDSTLTQFIYFHALLER